MLLIVVAISFKSWCMHSSSSAFMCLMTFFIALMIVNHVLKIKILIYIVAPTYISSMSFLSIAMTNRFGIPISVVPFFNNFG